MSAITFYKCSNNCGFKARLWGCSPIWKKGTPEYAQFIPVGYEYKKYVSGYSNDQYCTGCRSVVSVTEKDSPLMRRTIFLIIRRWASRLVAVITKPDMTDICPECNAKSSFLEEDMECPDCKIGTIYCDDARTMRF